MHGPRDSTSEPLLRQRCTRGVRSTSRVWSAVLLLAIVAGCESQPSQASTQPSEVGGPETIAGATEPSTAIVPSDFECPVTIPTQPGLVPPAPYPERPLEEGLVWYGTPDLWTVLSADGETVMTKTRLWWSASFPGGGDESHPDVRVRWTRLGSDRQPTVADQSDDWTTNGYTAETGWLMMAGDYPRRSAAEGGPIDEGCWRVEATYKGATLAYVVDLTDLPVGP